MEKRYRLYLIFALPFMLLLYSCGPTSTVTTVDRPPSTERDTAETETDADEPFQEITIGLIDEVTNFDPLFVENLSTMRVLSLVYDGLYTLDDNGEPAKAIASDVEISDDSLTYRININRDLFFHDSNAFASGVGRRIQASDIKWAFERTARIDVPPTAASLLMNIEGYSGFFKEQRTIYEPNKRVYSGVSGIEAPDNQTLIFRLVEPDEDFLKKLASPYLLIYPREAVQSSVSPLSRNPVGTGAYKFAQREEDGPIVFSKVESSPSGARVTSPRINRINLIYERSESNLFQKFAQNEIHWIPEMGPETARLVTDPELNLTPAYSDSYRLTIMDAYRKTSLYLHDEATQVNFPRLSNKLSGLSGNDLDFRADVDIRSNYTETDATAEADTAYFVAFTTNKIVRDILTQIQEDRLEPESSFRMLDTRVGLSNTAVLSSQSDSFHSRFIQPEHDYWIEARNPIMSLSSPEVRGILSSSVPWKLFIESVRIANDDRDDS